MTDQQVLYNQEPGDEFRAKVNGMAEEAYRPDYLAYFGFGFNVGSALSGEQTIAANTWTKIKWEPWPSDPMFIETNLTTGVMTFPNTSDVGDKTGVWFGTVFVGFKNNVTGLQLHTRKVRHVIKNAFGAFPVGCRTLLYDPAFGSTGNPPTGNGGMAWSYAMAFTQFHLDPAGAPWEYYTEVWHNATVAGSPVSLTTKLDLFQTPLLMLGRACKFS